MKNTTYPKLTNAVDDPTLIRFWLSQKSKRTQETYQTIVRQFLEFTGKELQDTMVDDILLWLESMEQLRDAAQNTINGKLATIKSLFSFGVKTGYLESNPASMIKTIKAPDSLNERLMVEAEVRKLIEAANSGRDLVLIKLLYTLGLRISELLGLNWSDFKEVDNGGAVVTVQGKGSKTRTLLIDKQLWLSVQSLPRSEKTTAVFLSRFGNRVDRHNIHRMIKKTVIRAGINPNTSAHWLRHAHATHSLKNGASVDLLMKSLGHDSLATTSRYVHVLPGQCTSNFIKLD